MIPAIFRVRLATGLAFALFAGASTAIAQDAASPTPGQPVTVIPQAADAQIVNRLERILKSTGWFDASHVFVHDGVVFLDGVTSTQEHQQWAGTLARDTQGTVAVVNRIQVTADVRSTFGRAANQLTSFYRNAIRAWPLVALAILVVIATWLVAHLVAMIVRRSFAERITSPLLMAVVARAFAIPIFLLGVYFVLQFAGLTQLAVTVLGGTGLICRRSPSKAGSG